jgi:xanthosine utilization system XapX-like protein
MKTLVNAFLFGIAVIVLFNVIDYEIMGAPTSAIRAVIGLLSIIAIQQAQSLLRQR